MGRSITQPNQITGSIFHTVVIHQIALNDQEFFVAYMFVRHGRCASRHPVDVKPRAKRLVGVRLQNLAIHYTIGQNGCERSCINICDAAVFLVNGFHQNPPLVFLGLPK